MHAPIFLHVASMTKDFMSAVDVGEHGVGTVERNTALSTMTPLQGSSAPEQKTSMASAVVQKKDLRKKATVAEDTVVIVQRGGRQSDGSKLDTGIKGK